MTELSNDQIDLINRRRMAEGKERLPYDRARRLASASQSSDATDFLIGFSTGIPMPSAMGLIGASLHSSSGYSSDNSSYDSWSSSSDSGSSGGFD